MPSALIVEDEPEANQLLALLVQLRGYRTDSAFTGREALALAGRRRPDVIFLDLMLPDTNGFEVCRTLKADPETTAIPVVMVTARLADENRIEGFRVGASEYLPKPYTPDQIFDAMTQAVAWRSATGALDRLTVPLVGSGHLATLRGLGQLRSAILARRVPTPALACRLDAWLSDLVDWVADWPRLGAVEPPPHLDYHAEAGGVTLALWGLPARQTTDSALAALIATGPFDQVEQRDEMGQPTLRLHCSATARADSTDLAQRHPGT